MNQTPGSRGKCSASPTYFTDNDVLCGRGRSIYNHPGNKVFRAFIRKNIDTYSKATKGDKSVILTKLLQQMRMRNTRIFKRDETGKWQLLGETEMKHKIGHALRDTRPDRKSPPLPMVSEKAMKSDTTLSSAYSTSAATCKPPTLAEMLDEIQQSKRRLLSQPVPLVLETGRFHSSVRAPMDALDNSNVETESASAALSATYNAIAHLGPSHFQTAATFGPSCQDIEVTAQISSTLSPEKKYQNLETVDSLIVSGTSEPLPSPLGPTSPLSLLLEIGKQEIAIHKDHDSKVGSGALRHRITDNDFETGNLLRRRGIEDLYRKLMSCPPAGDDHDDCVEVPPAPEDDGS